MTMAPFYAAVGLMAIALFAAAPTAVAQPQQFDLGLPTDNRALLTGRAEDFFQFVDREFEGEKTFPWEAGQFGFVRNPRRLGNRIAFTRFHEGVDVKPLQRDARGDPLDEVRAILAGAVVYVTATASQSNYGRYVVVRHDWGEGPFFSLYAHLSEATVTVGQRLNAGEKLGRMGYTGRGINQQRAHVHVELNLSLSSRFDDWHATYFRSPNHHGVYNGLNLLGLDLQRLYLAHRENPSLSVAQFVRSSEAHFEITVPGDAPMEVAKRYQWLGDGSLLAVVPPSWQVRCTRWGLPVSVKPGAKVVTQPEVTWIKDDAIPHLYNTRGLITGSGATAKLTDEGLRFVQLLCGWMIQ